MIDMYKNNITSTTKKQALLVTSNINKYNVYFIVNLKIQ